jgi:hypothetical protein
MIEQSTISRYMEILRYDFVTLVAATAWAGHMRPIAGQSTKTVVPGT